MKVKFFFMVGVSLKNRTHLKIFIEQLFKKEKRKLNSLNYIFCSDKELLEINRQYLKHDFYTDIITFELSPNEATEGEVYISIDRVKENARSFNKTLTEELHRVVFHGALHLCGYKDKTKNEEGKMRVKEEEYLHLYL